MELIITFQKKPFKSAVENTLLWRRVADFVKTAPDLEINTLCKALAVPLRGPEALYTQHGKEMLPLARLVLKSGVMVGYGSGYLLVTGTAISIDSQSVPL